MRAPMNAPRPRLDVWLPLAFALGGLGWIAVSDHLLTHLVPPEQFELWSVAKGWFSFLLMAALLGLGLRAGLRRLAESEERYRTLVESAPDGIVVAQGDRIVLVNAEGCRLLGASREELMRRKVSDFVRPEDVPETQAFGESVQRGDPFDVRVTRHVRRLDGTTFRAEIAAAPTRWQGLPAAQSIIRDLSERLADRETRESLAWSLRLLVSAHERIVRAGTEQALADDLCHQLVEVSGLRMAWLSVAEHQPEKVLRPLAWAGQVDAALLSYPVRFGEGAPRELPSSQVATTRRPLVFNDVLSDPRLAKWHDLARRMGYSAGLVLPLIAGGELLGTLGLYSERVDAFTSPATEVLQRLAEDVAFGLAALRAGAARKTAESSLTARELELHALTARLQRIREEESARIARDLHDELGQLLTAVTFDLRWLERHLADLGATEAAGALLDRAVRATALAEQTAAAVQRIASGLRPGALDQLGLGPTLEAECRGFEARTGIASRVELPPGGGAVPEPLATALYRIGQEALTNVARHAGASSVVLRLRRDEGWVTLQIEDDGHGLGTGLRGGGLGLLGMRERATMLGGELLVTPGPVKGTLVTARLPMRQQPGEKT